MRRLVEMRDVLVQAVDGDRVLDEVVGADGEEVDLLRDEIGGECGAGNLDHRADFHLLVERLALGAQLGAALLEHDIRAAHFVDARDHRVHHADIADGAGAEDGAELRLEDIGPLEAEPDGAPAEEGIESPRGD